MSISEEELAALEAVHCAPTDIEQWAHGCYLCGESLPCSVLRLVARVRELEALIAMAPGVYARIKTLQQAEEQLAALFDALEESDADRWGR